MVPDLLSGPFLIHCVSLIGFILGVFFMVCVVVVVLIKILSHSSQSKKIEKKRKLRCEIGGSASCFVNFSTKKRKKTYCFVMFLVVKLGNLLEFVA